MKTAYITLGCKCNQYETQLMEQRMQAAGFDSATQEDEPDVVIVNSCTVTAQSDAKARRVLHSLRRQHPGALLVFTGCMPQADPEQAARLEEADVVTGTAQRARIVSLVQKALETGCRVVDIAPHKPGEAFEAGRAQGHTGHTRAFVKIEDGCAAYCSYCIIPYASGPVRSKPEADIAAEVAMLAKAGFLEIVLVGINLSAWGGDLGRTLAEQYEAAVSRLRAAFPGCAITTDIIAGFPGETAEELEETLAFVRKIGFAQAHVFPYSKRPGTKAAAMPGQLTKAEKARRAQLVTQNCDESRTRFLGAQRGETREVLFESETAPGEWEGFTPEYVPVRATFPAGISPAGRLVPVRILGVADGYCRGEAPASP